MRARLIDCCLLQREIIQAENQETKKDDKDRHTRLSILVSSGRVWNEGPASQAWGSTSPSELERGC